jgi:hypothetical protein
MHLTVRPSTFVAAASCTAAAGATLVARHWRGRHRALTALYHERGDENRGMQGLLVDLHDAATADRIPHMPPELRAALHVAADPAGARLQFIAGRPGHGKSAGLRRWIAENVTEHHEVRVMDAATGERQA